MGTIESRFEALVVGGGPAGLAAAAALQAEGIAPVVLESGSGPGPRWRGHYDRLHLHTSRRFSGLPGHRFGRHLPRFVSRTEVVDYLHDYVRVHGLELLSNTVVEQVSRTSEGWRVTTSRGPLTAPVVVLATGYAAAPHVPDWPGIESFTGELTHVASYRNAAPYRGRDVLVVGPGNSGAEVAVDLAEGGAARVRLAVRTPPNILPRTVLGISAQAYAIVLSHLPVALADRMLALVQRVVLGDLATVGLGRPPRGCFAQIHRDDVTPILDVGLLEALRQGGVEPVAAVIGLDGAGVRLADGSRLTPDAVVVATGYRPDLDGLVGHLGVLDDTGRPRVRDGGGDPAAPGLYFVGYRPVPSGNLREIGIEARRMARGVARRGEVPAPSRPAVVDFAAVDFAAVDGAAPEEPIVLIPGADGWRGGWAGVRDLLRERGLPVLVLDLPGGADGTVAGLADLLEAELDRRGLARADLVGNSLGGWLALELARRGRARSVLALAPAGFWGPGGHPFARVSILASHRLVRALDPALPALTANPATRTALLGQFVGRPWRMSAPAALALLRRFGRRGLPASVRHVLGESFVPLPDPGVPVTVAWGARDLLTPQPGAARMARLVPSARVVRMPGLGHLMAVHDPHALAMMIAQVTRRPRPSPGTGPDREEAQGCLHGRAG